MDYRLSSALVATPSDQIAAFVQPISADLILGVAAGSSTAASPLYLAAIMGNVMEATAADGLTATKNMVAGVYGKIDVTGTQSSTYPSAGLAGEVGNGSSGTYAVLAVYGGDTLDATPIAMYGVDWHNSRTSSEANFGLDLQGNGTHDSYLAPRYSVGDIRLGGRRAASGTQPGDNVLIFRFGAAPANGTSGTGAGSAGPGSALIRTDTGDWYRNQNTLASPTWVLFSTA